MKAVIVKCYESDVSHTDSISETNINEAKELFQNVCNTLELLQKCHLTIYDDDGFIILEDSATRR